MKFAQVRKTDWYDAMYDYMNQDQLAKMENLIDPYYDGNGDLDAAVDKMEGTEDYHKFFDLMKDINKDCGSAAFEHARLDLYKEAVMNAYPEGRLVYSLIEGIEGDKETVKFNLDILQQMLFSLQTLVDKD